MRVTSFILHCAVLVGAVSARNAYLYTFDHSPRTSPGRSSIIASDTAYSIVLRRRGTTEDRYLGELNADTLEQINLYSGYQQPLFKYAKEDAPSAKLFVRIVGYDGDVPKHSQPHATIPNPGLELALKLGPRQDEQCMYGSNSMGDYNVVVDGGAEDTYRLIETNACKIMTDFLDKVDAHPFGKLAEAIQELSRSPSNGPEYTMTTITEILDVLQNLATSESIQSTLLILPTFKAFDATHSVVRRDEEPLDLPSVDVTSSSPPAHAFASNYTLPSKFPACFSSKSACENATNSCFGHGSCTQSHGSSSCYKCSCKSTIVRENADGSTKSVQWAGAACQKKDVSVPFFLFAFFGVAMSALVAGSIGMLYSMGGQELPSVIGAGVAGPRVQK